MGKNIRKIIWVAIALATVVTPIGYITYIRNQIPGTIYVDSFTTDSIDLDVPFVGTISCKNVSAPVALNLSEPLQIRSEAPCELDYDVKLLGLFKIKNVKVISQKTPTVIAGGIPIGIYIKMNGIYVVDIGEVSTNNGYAMSPAEGIIKPGDYILKVNDINVNSSNELIKAVENNGNNKLVITILRNESKLNVTLRPIKDSEGQYRIGAWVKDDCQGLGTLTYIDSNGHYGTLGHAISEQHSNQPVTINKGEIYTAKIWSVIKGVAGKPGEVVGTINYGAENLLGTIEKNCEIGVYGEVNNNIYNLIPQEALPIAYKQDVCRGKAYMRTYLDGQIQDFEIEITDVFYSESKMNKGIVFKVTDERLLQSTNGIVQGMSGSPIIQNGALIGAVTHVFVNEPSKGYGIFIENMLNEY